MSADTSRVAMKLRGLSDLLITVNPGELAPETFSDIGLVLYDLSEELNRKNVETHP